MLYPFPHMSLEAELKKFPAATQVVWCQDEPQNQGAWFFVQHHIQEALKEGQRCSYAGRPASASPAVGYYDKHYAQQKDLLVAALGDARNENQECLVSNRHGPHRSQVPQLSESVAEATLLQWHKKPGDAVERDQNLIEHRDRQGRARTAAPESGVLARIVKGDGGTVVSGEVIAVIDTEATGRRGRRARSRRGTRRGAGSRGRARHGAAPAPAGGPKGDVAMPAAAKLLAEAGLSASQVPGSGRDGRVTKGDVIAATAGGAKPAPAAAPPSPAIPTGAPSSSLPSVPAPIDPNKLIEGRPEQRVAMSRLRQRVAERLLQSQATNAILTTFNEVNMQRSWTFARSTRTASRRSTARGSAS